MEYKGAARLDSLLVASTLDSKDERRRDEMCDLTSTYGVYTLTLILVVVQG